MRWVKLTLPPRPRLRWLLMTMRLSISSLAGTARTLVAVGTWRLVSMLVTTRAAAPRSFSCSLAVASPTAGGFVVGSELSGVAARPADAAGFSARGLGADGF